MQLFLHQVLAGIATGGIYACMGLAVVMIYQAIDHLNFAQGEMAMFSTFIGWQLITWGVPYWGAFALAVVISFIAGVLIGFFARKVNSLGLGILFGLGVGLLLAFAVAAMQPGPDHYYFAIMLPGGIVGTIIGYATQRFGEQPQTLAR